MADQRYRYIQLGRMQELLDLWKKRVAHGAVDLMTKMLAHDPHERISMAQVLQHPWIRPSICAEELVEVCTEMEMEMDFGGNKEDHEEESLVFDDDDEEQQLQDLTPETRTKPRSCASPPRLDRVAKKSSPDSVFSFEAAYRRHTQGSR